MPSFLLLDIFILFSQETVEEDAPPVYTKKKLPDVTKSFHNFMVKVRFMICCINGHLLKNLKVSPEARNSQLTFQCVCYQNP